eukprot:scaffold156239_cov22-Tisochrysis_lutea.AAC.1
MAKPLALDGDDDGSASAEELAHALEQCTQWQSWIDDQRKQSMHGATLGCARSGCCRWCRSASTQLGAAGVPALVLDPVEQHRGRVGGGALQVRCISSALAVIDPGLQCCVVEHHWGATGVPALILDPLEHQCGLLECQH